MEIAVGGVAEKRVNIDVSFTFPATLDITIRKCGSSIRIYFVAVICCVGPENRIYDKGSNAIEIDSTS
jgi:hypothetical protein